VEDGFGETVAQVVDLTLACFLEFISSKIKNLKHDNKMVNGENRTKKKEKETEREREEIGA
jgi:hypothetical protein